MLSWRTKRRAHARRATPTKSLTGGVSRHNAAIVQTQLDKTSSTGSSPSGRDILEALQEELQAPNTSLPILLRLLDNIEDYDIGTECALNAVQLTLQFTSELSRSVTVPLLF